MRMLQLDRTEGAVLGIFREEFRDDTLTMDTTVAYALATNRFACVTAMGRLTFVLHDSGPLDALESDETEIGQLTLREVAAKFSPLKALLIHKTHHHG